ncbi:MAG: ABC transporter permease, partial [Candidatus Acidiferrales bacterium]
TLTGSGEPDRLQGLEVSANFLTILGASPTLGRNFAAEEDQPGSSRAVLLGSGLWRRRFGADAGVVGRSLVLNGEPSTVIGVLPEGLEDFGQPDLLVPIGLRAQDTAMSNRGSHPGIAVLARLRSGETLARARGELDTIATQLEKQYPESNQGHGVEIISLRDDVVRGDVARTLWVLLGTVGFVLLIACVNVANLLLARSATRQREMAVRSALGASRLRLLRQLLTESVLLATLGGIGGLLLAVWGVDALVALNPPNLPRLSAIRTDTWVLGFAAAVTLLTGLLFGLAPALQAGGPRLSEALKEGGRTGLLSLGRRRVRSMLVVAEIALALVLVACAGLMVRSFLRLQSVDPGFQADAVLSGRVALPESKYPQAAQVLPFYDQLLNRLVTLPGVKAAAITTGVPLTGGRETSFFVEAKPPARPEDMPLAFFDTVSADYFRAMGIPLRQGRFFTSADNAAALPVVVIDETLARQFFPGQSALGQRLKIGGTHDSLPWWTIVGVVGEVKQYGLHLPSRVQVYVHYPQVPAPFLAAQIRSMRLVVRAASDAAGLTSAVRSQILALDNDLPLYFVYTLDRLLSDAVAPQRFSMSLLGAFAFLALALAAVGLYGVMAYLVAQRTHEIGIRMALGAQRADIFRLVVGDGLRLALAGVLVGLAGAWAASRLLASLLFEVRPADPLTFAGVSVMLTAVALLACYVPARRAARVDPMVALRYE